MHLSGSVIIFVWINNSIFSSFTFLHIFCTSNAIFTNRNRLRDLGHLQAEGRETKKRTTLARLLKGLKTVNRRDRTNNQNTQTQARVSTTEPTHPVSCVEHFFHDFSYQIWVCRAHKAFSLATKALDRLQKLWWAPVKWLEKLDCRVNSVIFICIFIPSIIFSSLLTLASAFGRHSQFSWWFHMVHDASNAGHSNSMTRNKCIARLALLVPLVHERLELRATETESC